MPSNPYSTKRVNVVFDQETRDAVEAFAADSGLTMSKAVAFLAKEALMARATPTREKSMIEMVQAETGATAQLVSKKTVNENPNIKKAVAGLKPAEQEEALKNTQAADAQLLKLKLMQELMEQLKSV